MTEEDNLIWKRDYVQPLFDKYKDIPTEIKYAFIEKDYTNMYGRKFTQDKMRYMYDDSEDFIFAFDSSLGLGKTIKKNVLKKEWSWMTFLEYEQLFKSGIFWEFFPQFFGEWVKDKDEFLKFFISREEQKEYVKLILE